MSKVNLSGVGVGDVLLATRTLRVIRQIQRSGAWAHLEDVESGQRFAVRDGDEQGSWDFRVIKKGKRKYKVGDRISGKEVRDHMWKRGTVLIGDLWDDDGVHTMAVHLFLLYSGNWLVCENGYSDISFDDFADDELLSIAYLP